MVLEMISENLIPASIMGLGLLFLVLVGALFYVYKSLTMMLTAMKLKTKNAWLAWIPIVNLFLMAKMAKKHWWPILLLLAIIIPFVNIFAILLFAVFMIVWLWKITERRGLPGWLALLILLPWLGQLWSLILWGMLAWAPSKKKAVAKKHSKVVSKKKPTNTKSGIKKKTTIKKKPAKTAKKKVVKKKVSKKKVAKSKK